MHCIKTLTSGLASFWPLPNSLTSNILLSSSYWFSSCKKISMKNCFIKFGIGHNMHSSINPFYSTMVKSFKKFWVKKHLSNPDILSSSEHRNFFHLPLSWSWDKEDLVQSRQVSPLPLSVVGKYEFR